MATFALSQHKIKEVACYTASQFLFSGNAHSRDKPVHEIANLTGYPAKSVYRYVKWLINRNWIGKSPYGRYYFRSFERIRDMEYWKYSRAVIMRMNNFENITAFFTATVLTSLTETAARWSCQRGSSKPAGRPVSYKAFANTLEVSERYAVKLIKTAKKNNYIDVEPNLPRVINITPKELKAAKFHKVESLPVKLFGYADTFYVSVDRIRFIDGDLHLQRPNLINSNLSLKAR